MTRPNCYTVEYDLALEDLQGLSNVVEFTYRHTSTCNHDIRRRSFQPFAYSMYERIDFISNRAHEPSACPSLFARRRDVNAIHIPDMRCLRRQLVASRPDT